jgi:hypothetical protein
VVVEVAQFLLVAKMNGGREDYLVPVYAMIGLNIFLCAQIVLLLPGQILRAGQAMLTTLLLSLAYQAWHIHARIRSLELMRQTQLEMAELGAKEVKDYRVAPYYISSSPLFALSWGNQYASNTFSEALEEAHPNRIFYNLWQRKFYSFKYVYDDDYISDLSRKGKLLIQGITLVNNKRIAQLDVDCVPGGATLETFATGPQESLYKVTSWPIGEQSSKTVEGTQPQ